MQMERENRVHKQSFEGFIDIVEKFCAEGGILAKKVEKYREVIDKTATAELSV